MRDILEERRSHHRASHPRTPWVTALLEQAGQSVGRYTVQNLSAGGALLTGAHEVSRTLPLTCYLILPDEPEIEVRARVTRAATGGGVVALAVRFEHRDPSTEDRIQDAVLRALDRADRAAHPALLVVATDPTVRERLVERLIALGHRAVGCAAPLDALVRLADPTDPVAAVLAPGDAEPGTALLAWVAENRPDVRAILVVEGGDPAVEHPAVQRCRDAELPDLLPRV